MNEMGQCQYVLAHYTKIDNAECLLLSNNFSVMQIKLLVKDFCGF